MEVLSVQNIAKKVSKTYHLVSGAENSLLIMQNKKKDEA